MAFQYFTFNIKQHGHFYIISPFFKNNGWIRKDYDLPSISMVDCCEISIRSQKYIIVPYLSGISLFCHQNWTARTLLYYLSAIQKSWLDLRRVWCAIHFSGGLLRVLISISNNHYSTISQWHFNISPLKSNSTDIVILSRCLPKIMVGFAKGMTCHPFQW